MRNYDGMIKSTDVAEPIPLADYRTVTNEYIVAQSTAKWAKFNRDFLHGRGARPV